MHQAMAAEYRRRAADDHWGDRGASSAELVIESMPLSPLDLLLFQPSTRLHPVQTEQDRALFFVAVISESSGKSL
jgi:hypothetical protein